MHAKVSTQMKTYLKIVFSLCLASMFFAMPLEAKKKKFKQKPVYMIGVAFSLADSTVYVTDVLLVDSVTVSRKSNFLQDRQLYSFQLQRYLQATYKGGPYVPAVFFDEKKKQMDRQYLSLHKRYMQDKERKMVLVDQSHFRFQTEQYIGEDSE